MRLISNSRETMAACGGCGERHWGGQPRALLVFEDAAVASDMRAYLERAWWGVEACASRSQALDILRDSRPDVIVADCGAQDHAAELISGATRLHSRTKVVVVAEDPVADEVAGLPETPYVCLAKPILPRVLLSALSGALRDSCPAASRVRVPTRRIERNVNRFFGLQAFMPAR